MVDVQHNTPALPLPPVGPAEERGLSAVMLGTYGVRNAKGSILQAWRISEALQAMECRVQSKIYSCHYICRTKACF